MSDPADFTIRDIIDFEQMRDRGEELPPGATEALERTERQSAPFARHVHALFRPVRAFSVSPEFTAQYTRLFEAVAPLQAAHAERWKGITQFVKATKSAGIRLK
jgi:hypothetical protein